MAAKMDENDYLYRVKGRTKLKVVNTVVLLTLLFDVFGAYLGSVIGIPSITFTAIPLILFAICIFVFNKGKIQIDSTLKVFFFVNLAVMVFHILFCGLGNNEIKYFLYIVVFIIIYTLLDKENWNIIEISLVGISLFMAIDALRYLPLMISRGLRIYNVYSNTILDKSVYTLILTLAFICELINFVDINKGSSKIVRIVHLLLMIFIGAVNLIVIQSKLFVVVLVVSLFVLYFFVNSKPKKIVRSVLIVALSLLIIVFVFFPQIIPDYIYVFFNRYFGLFGDAVEGIRAYSRYESTYNMRGTVYTHSFQLLLDNPILGIGFGNYRTHALENADQLNGVVQTESSMLNILVEGGIVYFSFHIILLIVMLKGVIRANKRNRGDLFFTKMLLILIALIILNIGNDFYNIFYWLFLGFIYKIQKQQMTC